MQLAHHSLSAAPYFLRLSSKLYTCQLCLTWCSEGSKSLWYSCNEGIDFRRFHSPVNTPYMLSICIVIASQVCIWSSTGFMYYSCHLKYSILIPIKYSRPVLSFSHFVGINFVFLYRKKWLHSRNQMNSPILTLYWPWWEVGRMGSSEANSLREVDELRLIQVSPFGHCRDSITFYCHESKSITTVPFI